MTQPGDVTARSAGDAVNQELSMKMLFEFAARVGASDLLITSSAPPIVRVNGELTPVIKRPLSPRLTRRLITSLLNDEQLVNFEDRKELDFSIAVSRDLRLRANIYYQRGAVAGAFRLIPKGIPTFDDLGLPPVLRDLALRNQGLLLVTGPTGSGKSTTMASIIDLINSHRRCHIVTVEDPIEFLHENKKSVIDQREIFADTHSFGNALKYVLRQDPDVILVGEMRDVETISAAITAAETGHLVLATLHTNDSVQTIDRIIDVFPAHQHNQIRIQLAFSLLGIIAQQLIPKADGKGRVLATEILLRNHAVASHIREGKTHQTRSILESSRAEGMISIDQRLKELYEKKLISFDEVIRRVTTPSVLRNFNVNEPIDIEPIDEPTDFTDEEISEGEEIEVDDETASSIPSRLLKRLRS